ncbi:hypothetical protein D3C71_1986370 [compost metagenome]
MIDQQPAKARKHVRIVRDLADPKVKFVIVEDAPVDVIAVNRVAKAVLYLTQARDICLRRMFGGQPRGRDIDHRGDQKEITKGLVAH